jgi:hypothetical protein
MKKNSIAATAAAAAIAAAAIAAAATPQKMYLVLSLRDLRELTRAAERSLATTEANLGHRVKDRGNHTIVARTFVVPTVKPNCDGECQLSSTAFRESILNHPAARKLTKAERADRAFKSVALTAALAAAKLGMP